ncbi:hypothetical protein ACFL5X_03990 [Candidatus Omnitrophota bacterium]
MRFFERLLALPKDKIYFFGLLFFLAVLQNLAAPPLWGVDFLLLGLLFYAFFVDALWFTATALCLILLNLFCGYQFQLHVALSYLLIPLLARKIASLLNLNFEKYFLLCLPLVAVYILLLLAAMGALGFKNILILAAKNTLTAALLFFAFRHTADA